MKTKTSTKDLALSSNERLSITNISPFKPKFINNFNPSYIKMYSFHSGFKRKNKDLLVIIFDEVVNVECIYSLTTTPSAPIIWDKKNNHGKCKALIINAGNANAHTGSKGIKIINEYTNELCKKIKCKKSDVLVSSTGVIGEIFDPKLIINSINKIYNSKTTDLLGASKSIMTTDTYPKTYQKNIKILNKKIKIYGFAKGSGMIQPKMGTMLVYIFVECYLNKKNLKKLIKNNIRDSFNSITVDSDTSTSDTLMLFSISKNKINLNNKYFFNILSKGLFDVMFNLALQVIKDGEGISKVIEVKVINARKKIQAEKVAFSIANSPLVKTAIAGEDANWGRIIMAIGKTYEKVDQNKIEISFDNIKVCKNGEVYKHINYKKLDKYMKKNYIKINVNLNLGKFSRVVYGNDLTYEYVRINADYRS